MQKASSTPKSQTAVEHLENFNCVHNCRNTCAMLNEAVREETALVQFYDRIINDCDYPEVNRLVRELAEERSKTVLRIMEMLNRLRARASIQNGVMSSFDESR